MQNRSSRYLSILLMVGLGMLCSVSLTVFTSPSEAACRPTGQTVAGRSVVRCSGSTRCRPTGRYKTVSGVRYQILRCPG